jgi:hypothetical protein
VRLCQELKARGYKVLFYPMLQVDTITPQSKPWRGRITPTTATDANNSSRAAMATTHSSTITPI